MDNNLDTNNISSNKSDMYTDIKFKEPKRVLHFSDGILEDFSTDEEPSSTSLKNEKNLDASTLTWGPWFSYKAWVAGSNTLAVIDSVGEFLASFFGITTPKYYSELEEYKRRESQIDKKKELEKGWSSVSHTEGIELNNPTFTQPQSLNS